MMISPTKWTSFIFAGNVAHAFYMQNPLYHHMSLCVLALSLAVHHTSWQKTHRHLLLLDKIVAHVFAGVVLRDLLGAPCAWCLCPFAAGWGCWVLQCFLPPSSRGLPQACLHVMACASTHIALHFISARPFSSASFPQTVPCPL